MKSTILATLYQSKELESLLAKMHPDHLREDLKQELFLVLCEKSEAEIKRLHDSATLRYYAVRIVCNMVKSNTSPFFKKYRQVIKQFIEDTEVETTPGSVTASFGINQAFVTDFNEVQEQEQSHQNLLNAVHQCLDGIAQQGQSGEYEVELFKAYVEAGSAGKLNKKMTALTGHSISKRSICSTVKKVRETVKEEVKRA